MAKSIHSLDGKIIKIRRGLAIYKTHASPYWFARILDPNTKKYLVRSTKEKARLPARKVAEELDADLKGQQRLVPRELSFKYYATRFIEKGRRLAATGDRNANYIRTAQLFLDNDEWGLMKTFSAQDVRELRTRHFSEFMDTLAKKRPDLSTSTRNMLGATFRNVLKVARDDGVIDDVPDTPRTRQKDNPRAFFRFYPLVPKERDTYKKLLNAAQEMADERVVTRGVPVADELYDLILFVTHSFVRPTITELYALRHNDIEFANNPKRLIVTVRNGKTGFRTANTMSGAVSVYARIKKRYPDAKGEDYLFFPQYPKRETASRIVQRQFNAAMERAHIKHDAFTSTDHTVYSLRHTAICMRIILSEGQVNIFNLAKNAGTSVEQIERFYARNLPLSKEMAKNLQSFGSG
jgi:Phage integrase family